jgi:hypothetical protein
MLKRAALMLLVVPVQLVNFVLVRNLLCDIGWVFAPVSVPGETNTVDIAPEPRLSEEPIEGNCIYEMERGSTAHFGPDGHVRIVVGDAVAEEEGDWSEGTLLSGDDQVQVEVSCTDDGCEED